MLHKTHLLQNIIKGTACLTFCGGSLDLFSAVLEALRISGSYKHLFVVIQVLESTRIWCMVLCTLLCMV